MQTLDYRNFEYKGFHSMGACYVRVRIKDDGSLVCLIAQLRDYNGTSVTNVIEDIMYGVVKRLDSEKALPKALSSMDKILERSVWIERYAPVLASHQTVRGQSLPSLKVNRIGHTRASKAL